MSAYSKGLFNPVGSVLLKFTQIAPGRGVPIPAESLITGAYVVKAVVIANRANGSDSAFLKLWEAAPVPVSAAQAEIVLKAPPSTRLQYSFEPGIDMTNIFGAFTSAASSTSVDAPAGNVTANILLGV